MDFSYSTSSIGSISTPLVSNSFNSKASVSNGGRSYDVVEIEEDAESASFEALRTDYHEETELQRQPLGFARTISYRTHSIEERDGAVVCSSVTLPGALLGLETSSVLVTPENVFTTCSAIPEGVALRSTLGKEASYLLLHDDVLDSLSHNSLRPLSVPIPIARALSGFMFALGLLFLTILTNRSSIFTFIEGFLVGIIIAFSLNPPIEHVGLKLVRRLAEAYAHIDQNDPNKLETLVAKEALQSASNLHSLPTYAPNFERIGAGMNTSITIIGVLGHGFSCLNVLLNKKRQSVWSVMEALRSLSFQVLAVANLARCYEHVLYANEHKRVWTKAAHYINGRKPADDTQYLLSRGDIFLNAARCVKETTRKNRNSNLWRAITSFSFTISYLIASFAILHDSLVVSDPTHLWTQFLNYFMDSILPEVCLGPNSELGRGLQIASMIFYFIGATEILAGLKEWADYDRISNEANNWVKILDPQMVHSSEVQKLMHTVRNDSKYLRKFGSVYSLTDEQVRAIAAIRLVRDHPKVASAVLLSHIRAEASSEDSRNTSAEWLRWFGFTEQEISALQTDPSDRDALLFLKRKLQLDYI